MSAIVFKGDARQVAALAIEASMGERPAVELITNPKWIGVWRGKDVRFMCRLWGDDPDVWVIVHCQRLPFITRPWAKKYPDAKSIVQAAGLTVIQEIDYDTYFKNSH